MSDDENQRCQKINTNFKNILAALDNITGTSSGSVDDSDTVSTSYLKTQLSNYATKNSLEQLEDLLTDTVVVKLDTDNKFMLETPYEKQNIYNDLKSGRSLIFKYTQDGETLEFKVEHNYSKVTDEDNKVMYKAGLIVEREAMVDVYTYTFSDNNYKLIKRTWIVAAETIVTGE